jgi:hypothetical protein
MLSDMKTLPIERMGDTVQGIRLYGDPKRRPEPETFRILFPGGEAEVTRTSNGEYWVHIRVHTEAEVIGEQSPSVDESTDARLDVRDKHSVDCDTGDFSDPALEHLAVRVGLQNEQPNRSK